MSFWFVFPLSCCISPWLQPFVRLFGISVFSHSLRLAASPGDWQAVTVTSCQPPREGPGSQAGQRLGTEVLPPCCDSGWGNMGEYWADVLCAFVTYCPFWGLLGDPSIHRAGSSLSLCRLVSALLLSSPTNQDSSFQRRVFHTAFNQPYHPRGASLLPVRCSLTLFG